MHIKEQHHSNHLWKEGKHKDRQRDGKTKQFFPYFSEHVLLFFFHVHCVAIFGNVLGQGYPQSLLNINLRLAAALFSTSIIKSSVPVFFMGLRQAKYRETFPAQTAVWGSHRSLDLVWNGYTNVSTPNIPAPLLQDVRHYNSCWAIIPQSGYVPRSFFFVFVWIMHSAPHLTQTLTFSYMSSTHLRLSLN